MASWEDFERAAPDLAARGSALFERFGIGYLASVRRDGSPRLHAIVPILAAGRLSVFVPDTSPKRHDLKHDGRYALHAPLGDDDEEFSVRGRVALSLDPRLRAAAIEAAGHAIRPTDLHFVFDIECCLWAVWENVGKPGTTPVRRRWDAR